MSHDQYTSQARSTDLAQLEESDISPMILRSLVAGRPFARLPFLCPPHPSGADSWICLATGYNSCMCVQNEGLEDSAIILIATWYKEGPCSDDSAVQSESWSPGWRPSH